MTDGDGALVIGVALEVLAMTVGVTAAGEEPLHAATPISPAKTARTPDTVRNGRFMGAPKPTVGNESRARKGMDLTLRGEGQRTGRERSALGKTFQGAVLALHTEAGTAPQSHEGRDAMRRRIIRLSTAVTALAILLFGLPLGIGLTRYFISEQHRTLRDEATGIAVEVSGDQGLRQLPANANADSVRQFAVYAPGRVKIAGNAPADATALVGSALRGAALDGQIDGRYAVAVPVTDGNTVVGAVLATESDAFVSTPIAVTWSAMAALAFVALVVSWLLGRRQARVLARPLEDLARVAERLGDGDFSVRTVAVGMTEIDSVNRSINRTAARLGELLDRERTYTADASHQLRTPLTGLRFQLEAALEDPTADPRQAIRDALATTDRLEATITDLLALARDTPSTGEPLDINSLITDVRERWHGPLAQQGRPFHIAVAHLDGSSRASRAAVSQILDVLLDNAYHHGRGEVHVAVRNSIDTIAIDVTNQGPAISVGGAELFQRRSSTAAGHGIGLALARTLANAEGGRLTLSAPTPTFTLLLPRQVTHPPGTHKPGFGFAEAGGDPHRG